MIIQNGARKIDLELNLETQTISEIEPQNYLVISTGSGIDIVFELEADAYKELLDVGIPQRKHTGEV